MRFRGTSKGRRPGIARRLLGGVLFLLLLPIMLVAGLILLPAVVLARLLGFGPPDRLARHRCAGRKRARDSEHDEYRSSGPTETALEV